MPPNEPMTRRTFTRAAGVAFVGMAIWPASAQASLFGEENASLLAILAEMFQQVEQAIRTVEGVYQTVDQLVTVVQQGATMLAKLKNLDDVRSLLNFARSAVRSLQRIDKDVSLLGYKFDLIDQEHEKVFPTRASLQAMPSKDFTTSVHSWNDTLRESSTVAMRAQTSIESLQARAEAQKKILDGSASADGVVAQLQAMVQAVGLLHDDLAAIETNIAAGMRVTASLASKQAAEQDLREEEHKRMMERYTDEDAAGDVLTELP